MSSTANKVTPLRTPTRPKRRHHQGAVTEEALMIRREQFFKIMNVGRTLGDEMIRKGLVKSVKVGKTVLIDVESARALARGEVL